LEEDLSLFLVFSFWRLAETPGVFVLNASEAPHDGTESGLDVLKVESSSTEFRSELLNADTLGEAQLVVLVYEDGAHLVMEVNNVGAEVRSNLSATSNKFLNGLLDGV
jgi:hypothetical protein